MATYILDQQSQKLTYVFEGKLDTDFSMLFQPKVEEVLEEFKNTDKPETNFNFDKVDFVTSAFIRVCVKVAKFVGKENFSITNTNPLIKKTFKIAGLDTELNVE